MGSFLQVDDSIDTSNLGKITGEIKLHNKTYKILEDSSREIYFKVRELSRDFKTTIQLITPINDDKLYAYNIVNGQLKVHGEVLSMLYL